MAIDFSTSNTTRYYSVPDSADFTLPDGDWSWISTVRFPSGQSTVNPYYVVSTNTLIANSFNLFVSATSPYPSVAYNGGAILSPISNFPTDKWAVFYAARRSGNLYCGARTIDGTYSAESAAQAITGTSNGTGLVIGGRTDLSATRFWQGRIGYAALVSGHGLTLAEAIELANGAPLLTMPFASQIVEVWHGRTSNDSAFTGIIKGHVATKNGASYGTVEDDFLLPYVWTPDHVTRTSAGGAQTITAPLSANTNAILSPTVGRGAVDIAPGLLTNTNSFYTATIAVAGALTILPGLLENTSSFYSAGITPGAVSISPSLTVNANNFYLGTVTPGAVSISPGLLSNTNSFYSPTLTISGAQTITAGLLTNSTTFFSHYIETLSYPDISVDYVPGLPPDNPEALPIYVQDELARIAEVFSILAAGHIEKTYVAPANPYQGMTRLADGTYWNPDGAGAGVFCFYGLSWKRLG